MSRAETEVAELSRGLDGRGQAVARRFETPVLLAALLVIPTVLVEMLSNDDRWLSAANVLNWVIWGVFVLEFATLATLAADKRTYLSKAWLEAAVVLLTFPPLTSLVAASEVAGVARLARLIRLTRFGIVMSRAGVALTRIFRRRGVGYVVALTVLLAVTFGVMFGLIEEGAGVFDGVWWAFVTITTVGYGDFYPATLGGRILAGLLMIVGIGFVATLTATVAAYFIDEQDEGVADEVRQLREQVELLTAHVRELDSSVRGETDP